MTTASANTDAENKATEVISMQTAFSAFCYTCGWYQLLKARPHLKGAVQPEQHASVLLSVTTPSVGQDAERRPANLQCHVQSASAP